MRRPTARRTVLSHAGPRARPARHASAAAACFALAAASGLAACGGSASSASPDTTAPADGGQAGVSLATSLSTAHDSWAVLPVSSGPAFWEVFARPSGSAFWRLVTPPGVADTGGLVASGDGNSSLTVAVRPSDKLVFSPLAATSDGGSSWSAGGPIDSAVAASPDALAADGSKLIALLSDGAIETSANGGSSWSALAEPGAIAASPAGKSCGGAVRVTSISFGTAGSQVLAGGSCGTSGTTVFSYTPGNGWQRLGKPAGGQLVRLSAGVALVRGAAGLSALWYGYGWYAYAPLTSRPQAAGWDASAPLPVSGQVIASGTTLIGSGAAAVPGAWVLLSGGRAATVDAPGAAAKGAAQWTLLPRVPSGTRVLASGPGGATDTLAVSGATVTVWRLEPKTTVWSKVQTISVPVQYGSSS
jgi:hypothetical protein